MQEMQQRIMELEHERVAHGMGFSGGRGPSKKSKAAAKHNPWLKFLSEYRHQCKINGEYCDLKHASQMYHSLSGSGFVGGVSKKKSPKRYASKTLKRLAPRQHKAANKVGNKCKNYSPKNPKYWQGPNKCITYASHSKSLKKKAPVKRKGLTNISHKTIGRKYATKTVKRKVNRKGGVLLGGCGPCPNCGMGEGYMSEEY